MKTLEGLLRFLLGVSEIKLKTWHIIQNQIVALTYAQKVNTHLKMNHHMKMDK
mgnify:CR=1 FL=1